VSATSRVSRLAVVGLGLLGGSVARAARARGVAGEIVAVGRTPATLARARATGVVDRATSDLAEGVTGADLVVLCAPVGLLPGMVRAAWPHLGRGALLTDVGSVKAPVVAAAEGCPPRPAVAFVGGHPMAGSERSGFEASRADLFEGRLTLLTPTGQTPDAAVARLSAFWDALGSQVRLLTPAVHDRAVAAVSHLVHLAAYGLVAAADEDAVALAGPGFHDMTRVAASAETLWTDIIRENREPLLKALRQYRDLLDGWEGLIRRGEWDALETALGRARARRETLG
jgi:cyclohexadieny/prephenate dehydrogenase